MLDIRYAKRIPRAKHCFLWDLFWLVLLGWNDTGTKTFQWYESQPLLQCTLPLKLNWGENPQVMSTPNKVILGGGFRAGFEPSRERIHGTHRNPGTSSTQKDPKGRGIVQCENTPQKMKGCFTLKSPSWKENHQPSLLDVNLRGCTKLSENSGYYITNPNKALFHYFSDKSLVWSPEIGNSMTPVKMGLGWCVWNIPVPWSIWVPYVHIHTYTPDWTSISIIGSITVKHVVA